ncbi:unnamed protein product, partial [Brassica rapa subsp. narinosa]
LNRSKASSKKWVERVEDHEDVPFSVLLGTDIILGGNPKVFWIVSLTFHFFQMFV